MQSPSLVESRDTSLLADIPTTIKTPEEARPLAALISKHIPAKSQVRALGLPKMMTEYDAAMARGASHVVVYANHVMSSYETAFGDFRWFLSQGIRSFALTGDPVTVVDPAAEATLDRDPSVTVPVQATLPSAPEPPPANDVWVVPRRLRWQRPEERLVALPCLPSKVPLKISNGILGVALAEVIETEFQLARPPRLHAFASKFRDLLEQEPAHMRGRGDPVLYARLQREVMDAYASALAETRAELDSPDSVWARRSVKEWQQYRSDSEGPGDPELAEPQSPVLSPANQPSPAVVAMMPVENIRVPSSRRVGNVEELVESMRDLGLLQPIVVTPDGELIAGMHRLRAAKILGWTEIAAIVVDVEGTRKQLAIVDENLIRRQLAALEYAEALAERKRLYESLHPETQQYRRGAAAKSATALSAPAESFATNTAAKTGLSPRTIQEYTQVAGMSQDVRDNLRASNVKDKVKELVSVARLPGPEQKEVAAALSKGAAKNVKEAVAQMRTATSATSTAPNAVSKGAHIRKQTGNLDERAPAPEVPDLGKVKYTCPLCGHDVWSKQFKIGDQPLVHGEHGVMTTDGKPLPVEMGPDWGAEIEERGDRDYTLYFNDRASLLPAAHVLARSLHALISYQSDPLPKELWEAMDHADALRESIRLLPEPFPTE